MNLFDETNRKGKIAESAVKDYYLSKGYIVEDVSNDIAYQRQDIDMIINGQTVEVKLGTKIHQYGDLVIELISNADASRYKAGWFYTSKAQVIIWYNPAENASYQIMLDELRQWYTKNANSIQTKACIFNEFGNINKPSVIAFIPMARLIAETNSFRKVIM